MKWFVDCYCHGAICGRHFPVNSYGCESLLVACLVAVGAWVRKWRGSGIDRIVITRETKGQNPQFVCWSE